MIKIGSLCSGYGGLDMAVEYVFQAQTIFMSDIDKGADHIIKNRWNVPNIGDIKQVQVGDLPEIDILTAGYPCQPFSHAGSRKGQNDERHLWPHIKKIIGHLRPRIIILENVRGHLSLGFDQVLGDLTQNGYDAKWAIVRASDVGAPHRRERLFVVANTNGKARKQSQRAIGHVFQSSSQKFNWSNWDEYRSSIEIVGNTHNQQLPTNGQAPRLRRRYKTPIDLQLLNPPNPLENDRLSSIFVEYMMGLPLGWVTDFDFSEAQKFKLLGNGVVPQQAEKALELLLAVN